jgi:outer membrane immunogenic protein
MQKIVTGLLASAAIAAASAANAADLTPVYHKAPLAAAPTFSWTGCHIGTHTGLGAGHTKWTDPVADGNIDGLSSTRTANTDMSGALYGGQIGCDMQLSGSWVVGLEGSVSASDITGTNQDQFNSPWTLRNNNDWLASITGRIGFAAPNNILLYTKGGVAWAHDNFEIENSGHTLGQPSSWQIGWTLGSGLEWAFASSWSVFVETDYYSFGSQTQTFNESPGFINAPPNVNIKHTIETLMIGVNYRLWGGG